MRLEIEGTINFKYRNASLTGLASWFLLAGLTSLVDGAFVRLRNDDN